MLGRDRWRVVRGVAVVFAALWTQALPTPALAQGVVDRIPVEVVRKKTPLSADEQAQLRTFAEDRARRLRGDSPADASRARNELLEPLAETDVGVPFRLEYARLLMPTVEAMVADAKDARAVSGLRLAGELATARAFEVIREQVGSTRTSVRYGAAYAAARAFDALAAKDQAVQADTALTLIDTLGKRLGAESNPHVADALVRALAAAGAVLIGPGDLRGPSLRALAEGTSQRVRQGSIRPDDLPAIGALARAGDVARSALTPGGPRTVPADAVTAAEKMASDVLGLVVSFVKKQELPLVRADDAPPAREAKVKARRPLIDLASVCEGVIYFARQARNVPGVTPTSFARLLEPCTTQSDAQFLVDAENFLRPR